MNQDLDDAFGEAIEDRFTSTTSSRAWFTG
jgi:hypothetical protein